MSARLAIALIVVGYFLTMAFACWCAHRAEVVHKGNRRRAASHPTITSNVVPYRAKALTAERSN